MTTKITTPDPAEAGGPVAGPDADDHEVFMASVRRIGLSLGVAGVTGLAVLSSRHHAFSFGVGAVLGWLNFQLLEQGVTHAMVDPQRGSTQAVVWRFLLRFVLYGGGLYAMIAARSLDVLTATLGLSLFVFAIIVKGFYEAARDLLASGPSGPGRA